MMRARSRLGSVTLPVLLGTAILCGCSQQAAQEEQRRRVLLMPPDTRAERAERAQKARLFDDEGNLLESDRTVVGLLLPRGLSPAKQVEHQWYFKADHVPSEALEHYFEARLQGIDISRSIDGSLIVYKNVRPTGDANAPPLTLQITKVRGAADASELYVREPPPAAPRLSASQVEAQLKALRAHAE